MVVVENIKDNDLPFEKHIVNILSVVPKNDLHGIVKISVLKEFKDKNKNKGESYARYIPYGNGRKCEIEVNYRALIKDCIPKYLFKSNPQIACLLLSEYIFHEIGHHVHLFKKHGILKKKHESFADKYAKEMYFNYFLSRPKAILLSYRLASLNIFLFNKEERRLFLEGRKEL